MLVMQISKGQPRRTMMTSRSSVAVSLRGCTWTGHCAVTGTSVDSAQPTPSLCEAIQAVGDRGWDGRCNRGSGRTAGLGARHSGSSQCLPWTLTIAQWQHPVRDQVLPARIPRHAETLHQRNTILLVCPICRARQRHLQPLRVGACARFFSLATESDDEQIPKASLNA